MRRRQVLLPDELWKAATDYAVHLTKTTGSVTSVSEALRQLIEAGLRAEEREIR